MHHLPEDAVVEGDWRPGGFLAVARYVFECPADGLFELTQVVRRLAVADAATVDAAIPERLGTWLPGVVRHPGVRRALLLMAAVIFHRHPEEASVGRLMQFLQRPPAGPFIADDEEVGGMQGLLEPFARALVARGGEIALGWKPVEILVADGAVRGVVAVDRTNLVREVPRAGRDQHVSGVGALRPGRSCALPAGIRRRRGRAAGRTRPIWSAGRSVCAACRRSARRACRRTMPGGIASSPAPSAHTTADGS